MLEDSFTVSRAAGVAATRCSFCDSHPGPVRGAAFVLEISPKKANVVAAKGIWQVETEVIIGGKPDAPAAQKLAKVACSRLP